MKVSWTPEAEQDRTDIFDHIFVSDSTAAIKVDLLFSAAASQLSAFPMMGKRGKVSGTRELIPHDSYRLVYEIDAETVWILALVHTARQWPPVQE